MNCPQCNVALVMSERQGVEIDYCPNCRGVWLDRGELDKIIERSDRFDADRDDDRRGQRNPNPRPDYDRDHDRDRGHYDRSYKKKSFWHELFD